MTDHTRESNKEIRKRRTMKVFVETAQELIAQEGIDAVTTRRVAEKAGYNSTALYHYFDDLEHLIFLACMSRLDEYNSTRSEHLRECRNEVERYLKINERYFQFAYRDPDIFQHLFFTDRHNRKEQYTQQYFELFPERETATIKELERIAHTCNLTSRNAILLSPCVEAGYLTPEDAAAFNEMSLMIYQCILQEVIQGHLGRDAALEKSMNYYRRLLFSWIQPQFRTIVGGWS